MRDTGYHFRPRLLPTLLMVLAVALCVRLGLWQQNKAETKRHLQTLLDQRLQAPAVPLPPVLDDPAAWRYRQVKVRGRYEPRHQILLDNQVDGVRAGYHVITPLHMDGGETRLLVNRGWIEAPASHAQLPPVATPAGEQVIEGYVWLPPERFFTLAPPAGTGGWQPVWQNMDVARYGRAVPFAVYPVVLRMSPHSSGGGFARNWPRPAERIETHVGYAYQWFGFALAFFLIYLVVNIKKVTR